MKTLLLILCFCFAASGQSVDAVYSELSALPSAKERKAFVKAQPPGLQLAIWKRHFKDVIKRDGDRFNTEQLALFEEAVREYLNLEFFADPPKPGSERAKRLEDLNRRLADAFKDDQKLYLRTFEIPGDPLMLISLSACDGPPVQFVKVGRKTVRSKNPPPDCNCNYAIGCKNWDCYIENCTQVINCGFMGGSMCYYACMSPQEMEYN